MCRYFLRGGVLLQIGTAHIEGNIGGIDDSVHQFEPFGQYAFQLIGNENAVTVQTDAVFLRYNALLQFGEIENSL